MTTAITLLHQGGQKVTGTGTVNLISDRVGGYVVTDGTNAGTVVLRDEDAAGDVIFDWVSAHQTIILPTTCRSKKVNYAVSGTGCYVVLFSVVV